MPSFVPAAMVPPVSDGRSLEGGLGLLRLAESFQGAGRGRRRGRPPRVAIAPGHGRHQPHPGSDLVPARHAPAGEPWLAAAPSSSEIADRLVGLGRIERAQDDGQIEVHPDVGRVPIDGSSEEDSGRGGLAPPAIDRASKLALAAGSSRVCGSAIRPCSTLS